MLYGSRSRKNQKLLNGVKKAVEDPHPADCPTDRARPEQPVAKPVRAAPINWTPCRSRYANGQTCSAMHSTTGTKPAPVKQEVNAKPTYA
jgi:hypothetical protein